MCRGATRRNCRFVQRLAERGTRAARDAHTTRKLSITVCARLSHSCHSALRRPHLPTVHRQHRHQCCAACGEFKLASCGPLLQRCSQSLCGPLSSSSRSAPRLLQHNRASAVRSHAIAVRSRSRLPCSIALRPSIAQQAYLPLTGTRLRLPFRHFSPGFGLALVSRICLIWHRQQDAPHPPLSPLLLLITAPLYRSPSLTKLSLRSPSTIHYG